MRGSPWQTQLSDNGQRAQPYVPAPQPCVCREVPAFSLVRTSPCWASTALSCPGLGKRSCEGCHDVSRLQGFPQGVGQEPGSLFLSFPSIQKIASV